MNQVESDATPMLYDTVAVRGIARNGPIAKYNAIKNANENRTESFSSILS